MTEFSKTDKKVIARTAQNVIGSIKADVPFYVSDVDSEVADNQPIFLESRNRIAMQLEKSTTKDAGFMIIGAGKDKVLIGAFVPQSKRDIVASSKVWIEKAIRGVSNSVVSDDSNDEFSFAEIDKGDGFTMKIADIARSNAFAFLHEQNAFDEESSEEFIGFDDI